MAIVNFPESLLRAAVFSLLGGHYPFHEFEQQTQSLDLHSSFARAVRSVVNDHQSGSIDEPMLKATLGEMLNWHFEPCPHPAHDPQFHGSNTSQVTWANREDTPDNYCRW